MTGTQRDFRAQSWDERYRATPSVWGAEPNRFVERELRDVPPGRALDLACGEGRNALWLATLGWEVTAVDFSSVAVEKGHSAERQMELAHPIDWVCADVTTYQSHDPVDLALLCYLQVPAPDRQAVLGHAAAALASGGLLLVIGHDSRNLVDGTGGPQDASVLYTAADLMADLAETGLVIEHAGEVTRPVDGTERPAIDVLLRAHRQ